MSVWDVGIAWALANVAVLAVLWVCRRRPDARHPHSEWRFGQ